MIYRYKWSFGLVTLATVGGAMLGRWGFTQGPVTMILTGFACLALGAAAGIAGFALDDR